MLSYTVILYSSNSSGSVVLVIQFFACSLGMTVKRASIHNPLLHHFLPTQKPPRATKGWHQADGVATEQRRHTRVTPLQYNSIFSTNCGMDFELLRCGRLGKRVLELKRHEVGASFVVHKESWEPVSFERAGSFLSKRSQTMPKNKPTEPSRQEKWLGTNARLSKAVTEEQRNWSLWFYWG